jgi:L,D-transpeptidase catalytic domain
MASATVLSSEQRREAAMRIRNQLSVTLCTFALCANLSAQQTAVIVSLTEQTAYLLKDGRVAFVSPIASGKEGWGTPTGSFRVISKDLNHQSGNFGLITDSYDRIINPNATPRSPVPPGCHYLPAPMPYFIEFRKYVGLHAGYLPGYPASHGCVRMPRDLAAEFFARVQIDTPVKVIGSARNVTRVRRAIPTVQPGNLGNATAFSGPAPGVWKRPKFSASSQSASSHSAWPFPRE